ncbi:MAG: HAD family hydrolase [Planctomycetota bacterium]
MALERPRLVIFDVDGTLHDTFRWWAPVLRRGLEVFAEREGLDLAVPTDDEANAVVGMKDNGVWDPFLPPEHKHRWLDLKKLVVPMEVAEISSDTDYLFPGIRELLEHLRRAGLALAIASNCRAQYFAGVCDGLGLGPLTDHQFCLDSDRVETKTDMLRCALLDSGIDAQHAVMVGDREPDLEAAEAVGLPFIWRQNDRCDLTASSAFVWDGDPDRFCEVLDLPRISSV